MITIMAEFAQESISCGVHMAVIAAKHPVRYLPLGVTYIVLLPLLNEIRVPANVATNEEHALHAT